MSACLQPVDPADTELDLRLLSRELDKTKSAVFLGKNAAFLGSLMCSMNFVWSEGVKTAATDGVTLWWNPRFFLSLSPETRKTVLMHELWHPARLHMVRGQGKCPDIWNVAADHKINLDLIDEGYSFKGIEFGCMDPKYRGWAEEDIYDDLINQGSPPPPDFEPDIKEPTKEDLARAVNNVVRAIHQDKLSGGTGAVPGDIVELVNKFLAPVVPWEQLLRQWMTDLIEDGFSWRKPNRRYADMYMPSRYEDEGRLTHLIYYEDVSGSITEADATRFNSEVKYVKETFNPKRLSLVQFDTVITQEIEFDENTPFEEVKIIGRGGTSMEPVREHILKHRPTAAIIFSDLECRPMADLGLDIPVLWVVIRNRGAKVPFGKLVHIK